MKWWSLLLLSLLVAGCSIGINVATMRPYTAIPVSEPFAVIEVDEPFDTTLFMLVARVRTKDKALTLRCDYPLVLDTLTRLGRSLGANVMKIDKHLLPSTFGSTCHRVEARFFRADDATPYVERITWHLDRKLRMTDFMGDTTARPFRAATYCGISFSWNMAARENSVIVEAFFDPHVSYFKRGADDAIVLDHEQVHFDIAELYARILRKRISEATFAASDMRSALVTMHTTVTREMAVEQDRYDAEVYADRTRQTFWSDTITTRLEMLDQFSSHINRITYK